MNTLTANHEYLATNESLVLVTGVFIRNVIAFVRTGQQSFSTNENNGWKFSIDLFIDRFSSKLVIA